jgi:hypothetical protein
MVDIDKYRFCAETGYASCGRKEGKRGCHNGIAGPDAQSHQQGKFGIRSGRHSDRVTVPTAKGRNALLKHFDLSTKNKRLRIADCSDLLKNLVTQRTKLSLKIEKGYAGHSAGRSISIPCCRGAN